MNKEENNGIKEACKKATEAVNKLKGVLEQLPEGCYEPITEEKSAELLGQLYEMGKPYIPTQTPEGVWEKGACSYNLDATSGEKFSRTKQFIKNGN